MIHHTKSQENLNLNKKKYSIDVNIEMNQLFKLSEENFKAVTKMLTEPLKNSLDINESIQNIKKLFKRTKWKVHSNRNKNLPGWAQY